MRPEENLVREPAQRAVPSHNVGTSSPVVSVVATTPRNGAGGRCRGLWSWPKSPIVLILKRPRC